MSDYIIQRALGVRVFGEEQVDYTVGGVEGFGYDMAVCKATLRRAVGIEATLKAYAAVLEKENKKLEELSQALAIVAQAGAHFDKDDKTDDTYTDESLKTARDIMLKYDVTVKYISWGGTIEKANVDLNKTYIQNAIDLEDTSVQQNTVMIQSLYKDRDSAFKLASTLQQKAADTLTSGISNIR